MLGILSQQKGEGSANPTFLSFFFLIQFAFELFMNVMKIDKKIICIEGPKLKKRHLLF